MSVRGDSMLKNRDMLGSELKEKIEMYSELTGQDGWNVPITKVADFMSGFEMGKERFRKRGRWNRDESYPNRWKCSECGRTEQYQENYCPDCGSYMRDDEEANNT